LGILVERKETSAPHKEAVFHANLGIDYLPLYKLRQKFTFQPLEDSFGSSSASYWEEETLPIVWS